MSADHDPAGRRRGPVERLAATLGWRAGQLWTLLLGLALAVALLVATYPAALRAEPAPTPPTGAPR